MSLLSRLSLIFCTCLASYSAMATQGRVQPEPEAIPGEFLVTFAPSVRISKIKDAALLSESGTFVRSTIADMNIAIVVRPSFELRNTSVELLKADPNVVRVTPNFVYRANKIPNDALYGKLWGMNNTGQTDSKQIGVAGFDIGAEKAWEMTTGSPEVLVAIIDTGIKYDSPDLAPNMWVNQAEQNGTTGVDDDANGYVDDIHGYNFVSNTGDPMDDHGHGSHCAGTIGGKGNDGAGVVGVNWDVKMMGVKFLAEDGSGTLENAVKSIAYATQMGAKILSNSWGGGGFSQELKDVIDASSVAGAVFVAAAGNSSSNNDSNPAYPASYDTPNMIAVSAIDNRGLLANFSSYGKTKVHVGAPGVNILSVTTKGFESWSGTSMATPHVSGIAALLLSYEPGLTNLEIKDRILKTAVPIKGLKNKVSTGGLANAFTALSNILPEPDLNDPVMWQFNELAISTKHPYDGSFTQEWEVKVEGAKEIALYFSKFDLENKYDFLELYGADGKLITKLTGGMSDSFTDPIQGDYVKLVFKTDNIVNNYGFDLTKVAFR